MRPAGSSTTTSAPTVSRIAETTLRSCLQRLFRLLQIGDVESHAVNEPGPAIFPADHLGFAVKPDDSPVPRKHAIGRPQRFARKKQLCRFDAPPLLVVRMDLLVPADRIFQPLLLREAEDRLDLRAHVGFADALVQVGHEDDGGNLLDQGAVLCFQIGEQEFPRTDGFLHRGRFRRRNRTRCSRRTPAPDPAERLPPRGHLRLERSGQQCGRHPGSPVGRLRAARSHLRQGSYWINPRARLRATA